MENFGRKNGNYFRKERHSEILDLEKMFRPHQTRCHVSATVKLPVENENLSEICL